MAWQPLAKHSKLPHSRKELPTSRSTAPNDSISDAWTFLEQIDAPRWLDLSIEAACMGQEGDDPWFYDIHSHHQISLEKEVVKATQPRSGRKLQLQGNLKRGTMLSRSSIEVGHRRISILNGVRQRRGRLNKVGQGQSWPRSQVKRVQLRANSPSQDESSDRLSSPQMLGRTSSSSGCNSDREKLVLEEEKHNLSCSEISSVYRASPNDSSSLILHDKDTETTTKEVGKISNTVRSFNSSQNSPSQINQQKCKVTQTSFDSRPMSLSSFEICSSRRKPGPLEQLSSDINELRLASEVLSTTISLSRFGHEDTNRLCKGCKSTDVRKLNKEVQVGGDGSTKILKGEFKVCSTVWNRPMIQTQKREKHVAKDGAFPSFKKTQPKVMNGRVDSMGASKEKVYSRYQKPGFQSGSLFKNVNKTHAMSVQARNEKKAVSAVKPLSRYPGSDRTGWKQVQAKQNFAHVLSETLEHDSQERDFRQELLACVIHGTQKKASKCSTSTIMKRRSSNVSKVATYDMLGGRCNSPDFSGSAEHDLAALIAKHNRKVYSMSEPRY